jgi:hypothetical protein
MMQKNQFGWYWCVGKCQFVDDTSQQSIEPPCRFIVVIILFFNDSEVIAFTKTKAD